MRVVHAGIASAATSSHASVCASAVLLLLQNGQACREREMRIQNQDILQVVYNQFQGQPPSQIGVLCVLGCCWCCLCKTKVVEAISIQVSSPIYLLYYITRVSIRPLFILRTSTGVVGHLPVFRKEAASVAPATHKGVHNFLNTLMFVLLGSVKLKKVPAQHQHTGAQHVELQCAEQQALNRTGSVLPVILG